MYYILKSIECYLQHLLFIEFFIFFFRVNRILFMNECNSFYFILEIIFIKMKQVSPTKWNLGKPKICVHCYLVKILLILNRSWVFFSQKSILTFLKQRKKTTHVKSIWEHYQANICLNRLKYAKFFGVQSLGKFSRLKYDFLMKISTFIKLLSRNKI